MFIILGISEIWIMFTAHRILLIIQLIVDDKHDF